MKLLGVLFSVFIISLVITKIIQGDYNYLLSGNIAMSVFLFITGIAHFKLQNGMLMMMPSLLPYKKGVVYLTGFIEIAAAAGLIIPKIRELIGWLLIVFLLCMLPANYLAAKRKVNLYKADYTGPGMSYFLYQRVPMQIILIAWVYYFSIHLQSGFLWIQ